MTCVHPYLWQWQWHDDGDVHDFEIMTIDFKIYTLLKSQYVVNAIHLARGCFNAFT